MKITGAVYQLPGYLWDNVNTDLMLSGAFLRVPEEELGAHAFEGVIPGFREHVKARPILVGGANMGCGSSREQAPKALLRCGVRLVVAQSFGGIFFRNAVNLGLWPMKVPDAAVLRALVTDTIVEVDAEEGLITRADGEAIRVAPLARHLVRVVHAGGILNLLRQDPGAFE